MSRTVRHEDITIFWYYEWEIDFNIQVRDKQGQCVKFPWFFQDFSNFHEICKLYEVMKWFSKLSWLFQIFHDHSDPVQGPLKCIYSSHLERMSFYSTMTNYHTSVDWGRLHLITTSHWVTTNLIILGQIWCLFSKGQLLRKPQIILITEMPILQRTGKGPDTQTPGH